MLVACAARKLGCEPDQVGRVDGRFAAPEGGELSFAEVARAAIAEAGGSFHHETLFAPEGQPPITSFAAQIAEVEVDPENRPSHRHPHDPPPTTPAVSSTI